MSEFTGVYPAIVTPMNAAGDLNEEAFRVVYEGNVRAGAHGFWVAGGTGESVYLTEAENNRIAEIAVDQNGGRVKNIMHVGAATTAQAARQAEHAAKAGVDAICAVPPFFYGVEDEAIVEYYRVVGSAADLPLFAYNLPHATGVDIVPELMAKIQDGVPQLRGLKHSSSEFHAVAAYVGMGLDCFIGSSLLMAPRPGGWGRGVHRWAAVHRARALGGHLERSWRTGRRGGIGRPATGHGVRDAQSHDPVSGGIQGPVRGAIRSRLRRPASSLPARFRRAEEWTHSDGEVAGLA